MDKTPDESRFVRCVRCQKVLNCSKYQTSVLIAHIRSDHPEIEVFGSSTKQSKDEVPTMAPVFNVNDLNEALAKHKQLQEEQRRGSTKSELSEIKVCTEPNAKSKATPTPSPSPSVASSKRYSDTASNRSTSTNQSTNVIYTRRYKMNTSSPSPSTSPSPTRSPSPLPTARKRRLYRTSIERWRPANGTIYCPNCGLNKRPLIKTRSERVSDNRCGATCLLGCWPFCFLPFLVPGNNDEYLHCANCKNFLGLYDREHNCVRPNREFVENDEGAVHYE